MSAKGSLKVPTHLLRLPPLRIVQREVNIRDCVESYLEKRFYQATTVALHDWKTYGEMAALASDKYGLRLIDNHLPMGSLDTSVDILQIMRKLPVFVSNYNYSMYDQLFIERKSQRGSKHMNTVNIHSVASSVRQHGLGIVNTVVTNAYRYLKKQVQLISSFLNDSITRSYLSKERRWYKKNRRSLDGMYPLERAEAFVKQMRRHKKTGESLSPLDKCRILIGRIGNALAFVRTVRSATMRRTAGSIQFLPNLGDMALDAKIVAGTTRLEREE